MEVTVLHLADWLMEMQLDAKAGALLKADLEQQGMKIELQANSQEIIGQDDVEAIKLADGRDRNRPYCDGSGYQTLCASCP